MDDDLEGVFFNDEVKGEERIKRRSGINDQDDYYVNFFVIGPVDTESRKVTGKFLSSPMCHTVRLLSRYSEPFPGATALSRKRYW